MRRARSLVDRTLSATITAAGVVLLAAGLLTLSLPAAGSAGLSPSPTGVASVAPSSPAVSPSSAIVSASPSPTAAPGSARPTRVVVSGLRIDLPIVGTQTSYPLCDVAQYLVHPEYKMGFPGVDGLTTYIYAHARTGMFLPLLDASKVANGDSLKGLLVQVYTDDDLLYTYVVTTVKRHATDFTLASSVGADEQRLILQTSEGPRGTIPKLQVAGTLLTVVPAAHAAAHPTPHPVVCA